MHGTRTDEARLVVAQRWPQLRRSSHLTAVAMFVVFVSMFAAAEAQGNDGRYIPLRSFPGGMVTPAPTPVPPTLAPTPPPTLPPTQAAVLSPQVAQQPLGTAPGASMLSPATLPQAGGQGGLTAQQAAGLNGGMAGAAVALGVAGGVAGGLAPSMYGTTVSPAVVASEGAGGVGGVGGGGVSSVAGGAPGVAGAGPGVGFAPAQPAFYQPPHEEAEGGSGFYIPFFDPFKIAEEILVAIVFVIALALAWHFRSRVLVLLTGDDKIHGDFLDLFQYSCLQCCGTCHWEWTRFLTDWPCCPERWRGANIVRDFGGTVGVATKTIELSNIVVGDLPYYNGRGDFYVTVNCSTNPPMRTSVADNKAPKVVHFPETITLKLRYSLVELPIEITVRELNVVGSEELCKINLTAMNIIDWSREGKPKRFAMKPCDSNVEVATPPWIVLEFDAPRADVRHLDRFNEGFTSKVRTANWTSTGTGLNPDMGLADFKHKYELVDGGGNMIIEPKEENLGTIHCYRTAVSTCVQVLTFINVWIFLIYDFSRLYVACCWQKFRHLAMVVGRNELPANADAHPLIEMPVSINGQIALSDYCKTALEGTGVEQHWCRPSDEYTLQTCRKPPEGYQPGGQHEVTAFDGQVRRLVNHFPLIKDKVKGMKGLQCRPDICEAHADIIYWDKVIFGGILFMLLFTCCGIPWCANALIKKKRQQFQDDSNRRIRDGGEQRSARSP